MLIRIFAHLIYPNKLFEKSYLYIKNFVKIYYFAYIMVKFLTYNFF